VRKAVFALRQCLDAAIADNRIVTNPAISVPLPSEPLKPPRFLSQLEVDQLVEAMPDQYKAMVLAGAHAGLRWGEAAGLTRASIEVLRSRISVTSTTEPVGRSEIRPATAKNTAGANCPALRLIGEPYRQHDQQHPTEGKAEQHHAGKNELFRRDERGGNKRQSRNQSSGKRSSDDQPDASPGRARQTSRLRQSMVRSGRHDGLNSMRDGWGAITHS
jgi:integrase